MEDSIFTRIIRGEIPCHKIYEDEHSFAFLDIFPDEEGHTLLVPKVQVDKIYELDDEEYIHLWLVAKKIAQHYEDILGHRVIFKVVGVDVPHAHIHIVPYDPANHQNHAAHYVDKRADEPNHEFLSQVADTMHLS
jgi:histidine triad (HIT) family protein